MPTEIRVWQLGDGKLIRLESTMAEGGRTETKDLQQWIKYCPEILGEDIRIIGENVPTKSGPLDLLGLDNLGNAVIIELKRDLVPREAIAQAMDYASDVASWGLDKLDEVCRDYTDQTLDTYLNEFLQDQKFEDISWNTSQRILLVGTIVEEPLQRMIAWLSDNYEVGVNVVLLKYIRTKSQDELIARTMIIPEQLERDRSLRQQRRIPMSDEPGNYEQEELSTRLENYLSEGRATPRRIANVLLPLCLQHVTATRDMIKAELIRQKEAENEGKAGTILTTISRELGIEQRYFLRQVIRYDKLSAWEKENYRIEELYRDMIKDILKKLGIGREEATTGYAEAE